MNILARKEKSPDKLDPSEILRVSDIVRGVHGARIETIETSPEWPTLMTFLSTAPDRLKLARQQLKHCQLCEHRCGANRLGSERGPCHAGVDARIFRHRVECGEEAELIPSHLFYLSGCDLRCSFCIAEANAFDPSRGRLLTGEFLSEAIRWGRARGARNLQWVGGEPTIHIPAILDAMSKCGDVPPIVWKSDFHGTPEAFELLRGIVTIYVADFKFGNDQCAHRIARVSNYLALVTRNLKLAAAQSDLIVRHLLLPGHTECCFRPIIEWMRREMPNTKFSLRDGYQPRWQARRHVELAAPLSKSEADSARQLAQEAGLNVIA